MTDPQKEFTPSGWRSPQSEADATFIVGWTEQQIPTTAAEKIWFVQHAEKLVAALRLSDMMARSRA